MMSRSCGAGMLDRVALMASGAVRPGGRSCPAGNTGKAAESAPFACVVLFTLKCAGGGALISEPSCCC